LVDGGGDGVEWDSLCPARRYADGPEAGLRNWGMGVFENGLNCIRLDSKPPLPAILFFDPDG
jgi:hypothetical protein